MAPRNLLDLPREILLQILVFVFLEQQLDDGGSWTVKVARPRYTLGSFRDVFNGDWFMPTYMDLMPTGNLGLQKGTISALRVCRQLYHIANEAFYKSYEFETFPAESFRACFSKHISSDSLRHIRSLKIGLPHALKTMPALYLPRYLRLLARDMPLLHTLTVTTGTGGPRRTLTPANAGIEKSRGLLIFAAYVTLRHPRLKFATWYEEGTFTGLTFDLDSSGGTMSVILTAKCPLDLQSFEDPQDIIDYNQHLKSDKDNLKKRVDDHAEEVQIYAFSLAEYSAYLLRRELHDLVYYDSSSSISDEYWDENGDLIPYLQPSPPAPFFLSTSERLTEASNPTFVDPPYGMLLDSFKIRRVGFSGMTDYPHYRPYQYQVSSDAPSSEASTPALVDLSADEIRDELFKYEKNRDDSAQALPEHMDGVALIAEARAMEVESIRAEQLAKAGFLLADQ